MTDNNMIHIEEEVSDEAKQATAVGKRHIAIHSGELKETLGRLAKEATVRKITVKNSDGKVLLNIPFVLGAAGVLLIGPWTAALLAGALLTRLSILIEYEPAPTQIEEKIDEVAGDVEAALA
jgi:hypothetical protein